MVNMISLVEFWCDIFWKVRSWRAFKPGIAIKIPKLRLTSTNVPPKDLGMSCNVDDFPKFSANIGWMYFQNAIIETVRCLKSHASIDHGECNLLWYACLVQGHEFRYHSTYFVSNFETLLCIFFLRSCSDIFFVCPKITTHSNFAH